MSTTYSARLDDVTELKPQYCDLLADHGAEAFGFSWRAMDGASLKVDQYVHSPHSNERAHADHDSLSVFLFHVESEPRVSYQKDTGKVVLTIGQTKVFLNEEQAESLFGAIAPIVQDIDVAREGVRIF